MKPVGHPHRVANTRCRVDTVISPDDGHMWRIEINIQEKLCTGLVLFTRSAVLVMPNIKVGMEF